MQPMNISGSTKYSTEHGLFTLDSFKDLKVSKKLKIYLVGAANSSLTIDTWSSYKTAWNQVILCGEELGCVMDFPFSDHTLMPFITWEVGQGLACSTCICLLSKRFMQS